MKFVHYRTRKTLCNYVFDDQQCVSDRASRQSINDFEINVPALDSCQLCCVVWFGRCRFGRTVFGDMVSGLIANCLNCYRMPTRPIRFPLTFRNWFAISPLPRRLDNTHLDRSIQVRFESVLQSGVRFRWQNVWESRFAQLLQQTTTSSET